MSMQMDIMNEWLKAEVSSVALQTKQIILIVFIVSTLALVVNKIREIIAFINEVRNSKLNELQHRLDIHTLPKEVKICIRDEITWITGYRITGIADLARQKIIFRLLVKNRGLISVGFFRKFRTFLRIENSSLVFKKGFSFWFENVMYGLLSLQFLLVAILFIFWSTRRYDQIPVWGHLTLYSMSVISFLLFISFGKMIPWPGECRLLNKLLQTQYNNPSK